MEGSGEGRDREGRLKGKEWEEKEIMREKVEGR